MRAAAAAQPVSARLVLRAFFPACGARRFVARTERSDLQVFEPG
jgi:hypothetical protein